MQPSRAVDWLLQIRQIRQTGLGWQKQNLNTDELQAVCNWLAQPIRQTTLESLINGPVGLSWWML